MGIDLYRFGWWILLTVTLNGSLELSLFQCTKSVGRKNCNNVLCLKEKPWDCLLDGLNICWPVLADFMFKELLWCDEAFLQFCSYYCFTLWPSPWPWTYILVSENFSICHNFWTVQDRAFRHILHTCAFLIMRPFCSYLHIWYCNQWPLHFT